MVKGNAINRHIIYLTSIR